MKPAIIIPVYNHAASIAGVIDSVRAVVPDIASIFVINDGSTDNTAKILETLPNITHLTHEKNRGKGAALLTAFHHAKKLGFTHAITLDADAQHNPHDIPKLLHLAHQHPQDLIIGHRDMEHPHIAPALAGFPVASGAEIPTVPNASKKGRDISRFWLRVQTGQDIPDSQCGLRIYPLAQTLQPPYRFHRFDFETEVLARLAWGGLHIRSVPVTCIYFPKDQRVSHFRPIIDTLRGIRVNIFLVARRLLPLPFPRLVEKKDADHTFGKWWKIVSWRNAVRRALKANSSNAELATAFALGVFVGLTPTFFLQTLIAIYLAKRLHLNLLAAVIGSQISIPPVAPFWFLLSYGTGNLLLYGRWLNPNPGASWLQVLPTYALGSIPIALITALLTLLLSRKLLRHLRPAPSPCPLVTLSPCPSEP